MRSDFEKAYKPNPHKSPFTEVRFNEEKQIYEPLNPPLDRVARSLNAAWYGYRIRQTEVDELQKNINLLKEALDIKEQLNQKLREREDELQKRVDAVKQLIEDYRDPPTEDKTFQHALSIVADELEQALKGEQP